MTPLETRRPYPFRHPGQMRFARRCPIYNPLTYAWAPNAAYLRRYGQGRSGWSSWA
jgi:hypothetical protein